VTASPHTGFEIHGTESSLVINGFGDEATVLRMGADAPESLFSPIEYLEATRGQGGLPGAFSQFIDQLAAAITDGQTSPDLPTFADGLQVMRVIDAVRLAAREKRRVSVSEV
jgi:predicted dehydrogenase